jgi:nucleotide-binding universal stress UspA family protein
MKILLAIDDSKFSEAATQALIAHRRLQNLEVRVFHALEEPTVVVGAEMAECVSSWESMEEAKALVAKIADALRSAGANVTTAVEQGDPSSAIIDNAEEWGADLIVLGSHGRKGLERFLLGSVSESVLRHAQCSVEIVRLSPELSTLKAVDGYSARCGGGQRL